MVHPKSFLTPYVETPKDIADETEEDMFGKQFYRHAKFHADRSHRCRDISLCPRTKNSVTANDSRNTPGA